MILFSTPIDHKRIHAIEKFDIWSIRWAVFCVVTFQVFRQKSRKIDAALFAAARLGACFVYNGFDLAVIRLLYSLGVLGLAFFAASIYACC